MGTIPIPGEGADTHPPAPYRSESRGRIPPGHPSRVRSGPDQETPAAELLAGRSVPVIPHPCMPGVTGVTGGSGPLRRLGNRHRRALFRRPNPGIHYCALPWDVGPPCGFGLLRISAGYATPALRGRFGLLALPSADPSHNLGTYATPGVLGSDGGDWCVRSFPIRLVRSSRPRPFASFPPLPLGGFCFVGSGLRSGIVRPAGPCPLGRPTCPYSPCGAPPARVCPRVRPPPPPGVPACWPDRPAPVVRRRGVARLPAVCCAGLLSSCRVRGPPGSPADRRPFSGRAGPARRLSRRVWIG